MSAAINIPIDLGIALANSDSGVKGCLNAAVSSCCCGCCGFSVSPRFMALGGGDVFRFFPA